MSDPVLDSISKTMATSAVATSTPFSLGKAAAVAEKVNALDKFFSALEKKLFLPLSLGAILTDYAGKCLDNEGLTKEEISDVLFDGIKLGVFTVLGTIVATSPVGLAALGVVVLADAITDAAGYDVLDNAVGGIVDIAVDKIVNGIANSILKNTIIDYKKIDKTYQHVAELSEVLRGILTKAGCARNPNFCFLLMKCVRKVLYKIGFNEKMIPKEKRR